MLRHIPILGYFSVLKGKFYELSMLCVPASLRLLVSVKFLNQLYDFRKRSMNTVPLEPTPRMLGLVTSYN
jgi:hypothetical protein